MSGVSARAPGITTVSGQPVKRARIASAMCKVAGKNIPIHVGAEHPILVPQRQPYAPQAAALTQWAHDSGFADIDAIEFLRRTIRAHPGEITLLGIGPMTNLALLFTIDPAIPALLRGLVLMAGVFTNGLPRVGPLEWNVICDPHAAAKVWQARPPLHRAIGLDVTCQVKMQAEEVRKRFQAKLLRPVLDFAEVWFRDSETVTFHDPLAATTLFDSAICGFTRGNVSVELAASPLIGYTHWMADANGAHEIALEVDAARFFDHYFSTVENFG
jgi:purine nucleosidase